MYFLHLTSDFEIWQDNMHDFVIANWISYHIQESSLHLELEVLTIGLHTWGSQGVDGS
jgi:hypothetical protein